MNLQITQINADFWEARKTVAELSVAARARYLIAGVRLKAVVMVSPCKAFAFNLRESAQSADREF